MSVKLLQLKKCLTALALLASLCPAVLASENHKLDKRAKVIEYRDDYFVPMATNNDYSAEAQLGIYGDGKSQTRIPLHLQPFGRKMYPKGELSESSTWMGKKNPVVSKTSIFGDFRIAGATVEDKVDRKSEINVRLNLDVDYAFTATERIHAFFRPLDEDGKFTGFTFGDDAKKEYDSQIDFKAEALFFEGDLGAMWSGASGEYSGWDLPIGVGVLPLIFHNGIWFNDAVEGVAMTPWTAVNSAFFDVSNMDFTVFYAYDKINTAIQADDDKASIVGFNTWIEGFGGFLEIGYGYTNDDDNDAGNEQDYHNLIVSYSHRWKNIASLSYRVISNTGQRRSPINNLRTADGQIFLFESSLVTKKPYTLVPYLNMFFGHKNPQPLARATGGILQNVGILFEGDGITDFRTLDATGNNTWGGALGIEYLFALDQQLVVEVATVRGIGGQNAPDRILFDNEVGFGFRYQKPISAEFIIRFDGMYADRTDLENIYGLRTELRYKF